MAKKVVKKASKPMRRVRRSGRRAKRRRAKYVYFFGEANRRQRDDEAAARRQGRQPRRDVPHRTAGAAGIHDHHRGLHVLLRESEDATRPRSATRWTPAWLQLEKQTGKKFGDLKNPLLVSVRSGAPRLDAGHDGHDPQPRAERRHRRGAGKGDGECAASRGTVIAASCRCTATSSLACRSGPTRTTIRSRR